MDMIVADTTRDTIRWDAERYDRVSRVQQEWARAVLNRFDFAGDETVLDAGCGTGVITEWIAKAVPDGQVLALDISAGMVQQAHVRLGANPRVLVMRADSTQLPFRESMDVVFSNAVFHWVRDHDHLFRSVATALRPGGLLEAQCGGHGNLEHFHAVVRQISSSAVYAPHFQNFRYPGFFATAGETEQRLRAAGLVQIRVWLDPAPASFPSAEAFRDFCSAVTLRPFLAALPDELHSGFVDELLQAMPERVLDYVRLNVSARKPLSRSSRLVLEERVE